MSSATPGPSAEVKEEGSAVPEDSIVAGEPSPAPVAGLSKELTEIMNGIVRRLTDYRNEEYATSSSDPDPAISFVEANL
jgi:hypothetical protein